MAKPDLSSIELEITYTGAASTSKCPAIQGQICLDSVKALASRISAISMYVDVLRRVSCELRGELSVAYSVRSAMTSTFYKNVSKDPACCQMWVTKPDPSSMCTSELNSSLTTLRRISGSERVLVRLTLRHSSLKQPQKCSIGLSGELDGGVKRHERRRG